MIHLKKKKIPLIPPEDYFLLETTSTRRLTRKFKKTTINLGTIKVGSFHDDSPMEHQEDFNEGFTETVQDKIGRYNPSPRGRIKNSSFKNYEKASPTLRQESFFPRDITKRKRNLHIDSGIQQEEPTPKTTNLDEDESDFGEEEELNYGDSGILIIDIIDTGIGMTKEELKKLFQPFSQANSSIKQNFGGTGLGLWITKQIVQLMCGVIEVKSQHNKGTRFRIAIPLQLTKENKLRSSGSLSEAKPKKSL